MKINMEKIDLGLGCFAYKPPKTGEPIAIDCTVGVKFSQMVFISKSFLDQRGMILQEDEYDDHPYIGRGLIFKDPQGNVTEKYKNIMENNRLDPEKIKDRET